MEEEIDRVIPGRGNLCHFWRLTAPSSCLHLAHLVVSSQHAYSESSMMYLRKILVTTDLSEHSLAAMEYAASFGLLYSSTLFLLYVTDSKEGHHGKAEEEARKALDAFILKHISPDVSLVPVIRQGHPWFEIRKFAEEEGVDLIVIATHGRTGLRHIVMGSVAERTVRHSNIPVLSIKPKPLRESILEKEDVEQELHLR